MPQVWTGRLESGHEFRERKGRLTAHGCGISESNLCLTRSHAALASVKRSSFQPQSANGVPFSGISEECIEVARCGPFTPVLLAAMPVVQEGLWSSDCL